MMLTVSDYLALAGPTVTVGLYVVASLRRSRIERDAQHQEGQHSLAALKDSFHDFKDDIGNRVTALEVTIEHSVFGRRRE